MLCEKCSYLYLSPHTGGQHDFHIPYQIMVSFHCNKTNALVEQEHLALPDYSEICVVNL
jgi:hypothetical protein